MVGADSNAGHWAYPKPPIRAEAMAEHASSAPGCNSQREREIKPEIPKKPNWGLMGRPLYEFHAMNHIHIYAQTSVPWRNVHKSWGERASAGPERVRTVGRSAEHLNYEMWCADIIEAMSLTRQEEFQVREERVAFLVVGYGFRIELQKGWHGEPRWFEDGLVT